MTVAGRRTRAVSARLRAAIRLVTFTDRIAQSAAVMQNSFRLGIEAPAPRADEYRGSGKPLDWE